MFGNRCVQVKLWPARIIRSVAQFTCHRTLAMEHMKKTDLEKNKALKIMEKMKKGGTPDRFSSDSASAAIDRREQRKLDQAQGLVAFPVKIKQTQAEEIRALATAQGVSTNEVVGALLEKALKS